VSAERNFTRGRWTGGIPRSRRRDNRRTPATRHACGMHRTTSTYLDLIRFGAALVVLIYHASPARLTGGIPGLWRIGGLADAAVMLFFVLSGFVIAYVADTKERTLKSYSISRLARLYSVVVPAIVLTLIVDFVGTRLAPTLYTDNWFRADDPLWRIAANLLFVNELWFSSVSPFSNTPFWSIGYEFWYYVMFAAAFYFRSWARVAAVSAAVLVAGPKVAVLLPVWLAGVVAYRVSQSNAVSEPIGVALAVGSAAGFVAFRVFGVNDLLVRVTADALGPAAMQALHFSSGFLSAYATAVLFALHLVGISAVAGRLAPWLPERPIRYLAGFTFALYLFHFPLLHFFAAIAESTGTSAYKVFIVPAGTLGLVWLLGEFTEKRKATVRRWVTWIYEAVAQRGRWRAAALARRKRSEP
jgi:peptidoglycan/LPS O-acetylase OafA/YrhL